MANTYKILGQFIPTAASTLEQAYVVPASTSAVISTMSVCNVGVSTTIRVAVKPAEGTAINNKHYIIFDTVLNQYDTLFFTLGLSLAAANVIHVSAGTVNVSFNMYGTEIT